MWSRWHRLLKLWESAQVELHGKCSIERVQALAKYADETSWLHAIGIIVLTPLPCLVVTIFVDVIPLADPSKGLEANTMFFVRSFYTFLVITFLAILQFRLEVPELPHPRSKHFLNTLLVSILCVGITYALSLVIGFPLPFSLITVMPSWLALISITLVIEWVKKIRETPSTITMVVNSIKLWLCQVLLVSIYPPYFYVFTTLTHTGQMAFALLLPVIKITLRNIFARTVVHHSDEMPEIIVFNVDVFNALFLSYCMQSSPSVWTTLEIMTADVLLLGVSFRDAENIRQRLMELERRVDLQTSWNSFLLQSASKGVLDRLPTSTLKRVSILLNQEESPDITLVSPFIKLKSASSSLMPILDDPANTDADVNEKVKGPIVAWSNNTLTTPLHSAMNTSGGSKIQPVDKSAEIGMSVLPASLSYTRKVQRLLYMAEFLLLLNYVEVIIPLIFSIYLGAMYQLPNRDYYAQIVDMERDKLLQTLKNVLFYCLLQFISLLLLIFVMQLKLGLSPAHQLAFVLEKQYAGVQLKIVFWVFYNVQASLQHSGYDYTFRFLWLQH